MTVPDDSFLSLLEKTDKFVFITIFFKFFLHIYRVFGKFQTNIYKFHASQPLGQE
jgi:hypothetical protein